MRRYSCVLKTVDGNSLNYVIIFRMLDDFGNELENTESKLDTTMKKVAKVLHMNNGEYDSESKEVSEVMLTSVRVLNQEVSI